jgi:predicted anti-sigma-YlaC factor YlaD
MSDTHVRNLLGGYSLGILDAEEKRAVDDHVANCAECRVELTEVNEATELLALLPSAEANRLFAEDAEPIPTVPLSDDLVLRRTLRAVRAERNSARVRRLSLVAAGVAILVGASVASGYVVGDQSTESPPVASAPPAASPGGRLVTATDPTTGVAASVNLVPAGNWMRFAVKVKGVKAGERCKIIAISKDGKEQVAGSWVIGQKPPPVNAPGVPGSAAIAPADLAAVAVETEAGRRLVTVRA